MKECPKSKLVLSLIAFLMMLAALAIPLSGVITHSHAVAPATKLHIITQAKSNTFSGRGIVAQATVVGTTILVCDTGNLPSTGGTVSCNLVNASLTNGIVVAGTFGLANANSTSTSSSVTTKAVATTAALTIAGLGVNADVLDATATASCTNGKPSVTGDSTIANLKIGGLAPVNGPVAPNTPLVGIGLLGLTVTGTLNEQLVSANKSSITVNALHLTIKDPVGGVVADVIISQAHADIQCAGAPKHCPCKCPPPPPPHCKPHCKCPPPPPPHHCK